MSNYIELCRRAIDSLVDQEVEAVQSFIRDELQAPTEKQLAAMIAQREIKVMRNLEREAGL